MPEDKKDKYEELESLPDIDNKESELEELPVETVPEPFGGPTQPMDDLQEQSGAQEVRETPPESAQESDSSGSGTDLGKKIEEAARVRDASEYLRGQKKVKVIKKSAIKEIVDGIIRQYSGMEHKDLLSKLAEYELQFSNLNQDKDSLAAEVERLHREREAFQEEAAIRYEKEIEDLRARLAAAEEMLAQDSSKEKVAKLEEEVIYLRQRVKDLEKGLEFAAVVEEYDYGMAIESVMEQKQKIAQISDLLDKEIDAEPEKQGPKLLKELLSAMSVRYDFLVELFKDSQHSYTGMFNKVTENEGSIAVVAELVRLNARNQGWDNELEICQRFLDAAENAVRGK
jgi:hypothetical protein